MRGDYYYKCRFETKLKFQYDHILYKFVDKQVNNTGKYDNSMVTTCPVIVFLSIVNTLKFKLTFKNKTTMRNIHWSKI